jgi:hypothetical protein
MKKIFTILSLALSTAAFSQVTVTYQVDITEYIAGGVALDPNGIRVGGNFTTAGASIPDWTPSDPASAMTDLGNGLWSIAVTYPATSVGTTQLYKFVNGNWGTNEGVATSLIAEDQCGTDDGGGNINRTLVIPATNTTVTFCWDKCAACISSIDEVNKVNVVAFPNPATDVVNFQVDAADYVITLTDLAGKTVATSTTSTIEMSGLSSGAYLYKVVTNNGTATGKVTKN